MSRISIEYNPDLSGEAKELIRKNITQCRLFYR